MTPFYANLCALCAIAHVIAKRIFLCNTLVCFHNQMCNECSDQDNHNQAGDEAIAREPVVISVPIWYTKNCDCEACCKLQTNAAEQPFLLLISEFIAPIAAKQGGVYRLNIRYARAATFVRPIMVAT